MQVDRVPAGMDAMDEDGLEAMYLERMKESFLRAPDWAESSQKIEQPKDGGEAVNFGKYTPRRVATRDVVEPDYGGYVRRQVNQLPARAPCPLRARLPRGASGKGERHAKPVSLRGCFIFGRGGKGPDLKIGK